MFDGEMPSMLVYHPAHSTHMWPVHKPYIPLCNHYKYNPIYVGHIMCINIHSIYIYIFTWVMTCLFYIFGNEEQAHTHKPIEYCVHTPWFDGKRSSTQRIIVSRHECASGKVDGRLSRPFVPLPLKPFPVLVLGINDNDLPEEQDQFAGPTSKSKRNDDSKQIASCGLRMQLRHNFILNNVNVEPRSTQTFNFSLFKMFEEIRNVDFRSTATKDPPKSSQRHIKLMSKACLKHSSNSSSAHINFQLTIHNQVKVSSKSSWIQNQPWIHRNSMWTISIPVSELCSFQCHNISQYIYRNISQHTTTYHIPWYCATSK